MMKHDYCFAFCNRETRRKCRHECDKWTVDDPIEQSLLDLQVWGTVFKKGMSAWRRKGTRFAEMRPHDGIPWDHWMIYKNQPIIDDMTQYYRGRDCWLLWLNAIDVDTIGYTTFDDVINQLKDNQELAVENGLDSMLEAYHAGVPVEDIVA